ncbi:hypothetical protein ACRAWD_21915 [Caulobacter segnis]
MAASTMLPWWLDRATATPPASACCCGSRPGTRRGLPPELTVRDAFGRPVAVDPSNPAYLDGAGGRARSTRMVSPDGLDADGFKVDFTQRALRRDPAHARRRRVGHQRPARSVRTIHDAAKAAKPDALVVTHTVHPSFSGVTDMVRLNDVLEDSVHGDPVPVGDQLRYRHDIAAASLPRPPHRHRPVADAESGGVARILAHPSPELGVPALVLRRVDRQQPRGRDGRDLREIAELWRSLPRSGAARRHAREGADDRMSTFTEVAPGDPPVRGHLQRPTMVANGGGCARRRSRSTPRLRRRARPPRRARPGDARRRADDAPPPRPGTGAAARRRREAIPYPRVPPVEQDLFTRVDEMWSSRALC